MSVYGIMQSLTSSLTPYICASALSPACPYWILAHAWSEVHRQGAEESLRSGFQLSVTCVTVLLLNSGHPRVNSGIYIMHDYLKWSTPLHHQHLWSSCQPWDHSTPSGLDESDAETWSAPGFKWSDPPCVLTYRCWNPRGCFCCMLIVVLLACMRVSSD